MVRVKHLASSIVETDRKNHEWLTEKKPNSMVNKILNQLNNKFLNTCKLTKVIEEKVNSINFVTTKMIY